MMPQEVFLSHAAADQDIAARLTDVLRRHGVPIWYSATNILGAQQWQDEIGAALKRCDGFLLLLTACDYEQLSWTLSAMQFVSFANGFEQGCRDLLKVWGLGYKTI